MLRVWLRVVERARSRCGQQRALCGAGSGPTRDVGGSCDLLSEPSWSLHSLGLLGREGGADAVITPEKLEYLAQLSQLSLDSAAIDTDKLSTDVDAIMQCVRTVQGVSAGQDAGDVYVGLGGGASTPLRDDDALDACEPEDVLSNAPHREGNFYVVPQVLDDDGAL